MKKETRKYNIDDNFFSEINSESKAYILGLLYADGCVYNSQGNVWAKLDLMYDDRNLLYKIAKEMKNDCPIRRHTYERSEYFQNQDKIYEFTHDMCRYSMRSNKIVSDLIKLGCPPTKTFKIIFPSPKIVPDDYMRHFLRGYLDGDGSLSGSPRKSNSKYRDTYLHFHLTFTGTLNFVSGIKEYLNNNVVKFIGDIRSRWDNGHDNYTLSIDGNNILEKILDWLYEDSTIFLQRKYDKYLLLKEKILNKNKSITYSCKNRNPIRNEPFNIYKNGEYIGTCDNRRKLERESKDILGEHISRLVFTECLHKKRSEYHNFKFIFISEDEFIESPIYICSGKETISKDRKIIQYDLDGKYIKLWNSTEGIVEWLNMDRRKVSSSVLSCCKHNQKTAFGYIWKYADEVNKGA